jgi:hypothetical protein
MKKTMDQNPSKTRSSKGEQMKIEPRFSKVSDKYSNQSPVGKGQQKATITPNF